MRRSVLIAAVLMSGLARTAALEAGVYNLDAPRKYPSDYVETNSNRPMDRVMVHLGELKQLLVKVDPKKPPKPDSLRTLYENQLEKLKRKQADKVLTAADRVNLSGCLIRFSRYAEAEEVLQESLRVLPPDNPYRCLLLLHWAVVAQDKTSNGADLQSALRFQEQALDCWPVQLPDWNRWESAWYRQCERYALALMKLRAREKPPPFGENPPPDLLFPREELSAARKARFVGDSGKYEPGGIARKQEDRLPADADRIVLQLLLWQPQDMRLLWLYGELLNARGDVYWALYALTAAKGDPLQGRTYRNDELDRHRQILKNAVGPFERLFRDEDGSGAPFRLQTSLLWSFAPRLGPAFNEVAGLAMTSPGAGAANSFPAPPPPAGDNSPPTTAANPLPDWRQLTVGFLAGVVIAVLVLLQWQQRRRHHSWIVDRGA
jgi:hypothetical protein